MTPSSFAIQGAGLTAVFLDLGATLVSLRAPDREGREGEVVLGFDDPARYASPHPCLGSTVGRFANRIGGARFELGGRTVLLDANEGPNHLHGGAAGFHLTTWQVEGASGQLRFRLRHPDGASGYPGNLDATVTYRLETPSTLRVDFEATTDRTTVVGMTQHTYWNLRDGGASRVLDHELRVEADAFTPTDPCKIPLGEIAGVTGPLDLRRPRRLRDVVDALGDGLDHNFVVRGAPGRLRPAALLRDPASGRTLHVETTQPGLQVYTGQHLGGLSGRAGARYDAFHGVCLETQHFPDAVHHAAFPSPVLEPGERYHETTLYRLGVA